MKKEKIRYEQVAFFIRENKERVESNTQTGKSHEVN